MHQIYVDRSSELMPLLGGREEMSIFEPASPRYPEVLQYSKTTKPIISEAFSPFFEELEISAKYSNNRIEYCHKEQPTEIMSQMDGLRENHELCDVELEVNGQVIKAHRYVLAAASPYFRAMFTNGMVEMKKEKIVLKDFTYESLTALVDYIYTNRIIITPLNVQHLIFTASILQMDNIVGACQQFLSNIITIQNCLRLHQFAETYNCQQLLSTTNNFAADHFEYLKSRSDFMSISYQHLRGLLNRPDLNVTDERQVFDTIMEWIDYDIDNRIEYVLPLMETVRLHFLTSQFLLRIVKNHRHIKENQKCREMVYDVLTEMLTESAENLELEDSLQYSSALKPKLSKSRKSIAGVIFVAGGRGTAGGPFNSVEAYNWRKDSWMSIPEMTTQRRHVGVVSAHGKLYAIGGHDGTHHLSSAEVFDPKTGKWSRIMHMNIARRGISVATLDMAIYVMGGLDDTTCFKTVERYDIELNEWSRVADMREQRGGVSVASLGKYLYAIGGNDGISSLDSCEKFDPLLDKWKDIAKMKNRRAGSGVCVLDGYVYAVGGFDDNAPTITCEKYDPVIDKWTSICDMTCARGGVGVAAMGGKVYAIGGHDGANYLNTVECYDPSEDCWTRVGNIKECRAGAGVAWSNCHIYQLTPLQKSGYDSGCAPSNGAHCI